MAKGKEKEEKPDVTETAETSQELTPLTQEDTYLAKAKEEADAKAWEKYQGMQRVLAERERRIAELEAQVVSPSPSVGDDKLIELMIQDRKGKAEFGEPDPIISQLEKELERRKYQQTQQVQLQWQQQVTRQWQEKFNQQIKEAGLDPQDELLDDFHDAFEDAKDNGKFGKAERKLNRILSKAKPTKAKPAETEDERIDRLAEEKYRAKLEEKGLLATDTGLPSGVGGPRTKAEAAQLYAAGKLTDSEYREWRYK